MEPLITLLVPEGTSSVHVDGVPFPVENGMVAVPESAVATLVSHHGFQVRGAAPKSVVVEVAAEAATAPQIIGKVQRAPRPANPPADPPAGETPNP